MAREVQIDETKSAKNQKDAKRLFDLVKGHLTRTAVEHDLLVSFAEKPAVYESDPPINRFGKSFSMVLTGTLGHAMFSIVAEGKNYRDDRGITDRPQVHVVFSHVNDPFSPLKSTLFLRDHENYYEGDAEEFDAGLNGVANKIRRSAPAFAKTKVTSSLPPRTAVLLGEYAAALKLDPAAAVAELLKATLSDDWSPGSREHCNL